MQVETAGGAVEITWGINRWVLVEAPGGGLQRQVSTRAELVALIVEMGVGWHEAERAADAFWRTRPAEAGLGAATGGEAPWKATGLPTWAIVLILLGSIALFVVFRLQWL